MCNDESTIVWEEIESVLRAFEKLTRGDDSMNAAMMTFGENMLTSLDRRVGWEPKADDGHMGKMLRAVLIRLQATFCKSDENVAAKAHALFDTPEAIPNDLKSAVYKIALQSSHASDGAARHATMMGASRRNAPYHVHQRARQWQCARQRAAPRTHPRLTRVRVAHLPLPLLFPLPVCSFLRAQRALPRRKTQRVGRRLCSLLAPYRRWSSRSK